MAGISNGRAEERAMLHIRIPNDDILFQKYFTNIRKLGEGTFGVVTEVERLSDSTRWAIKTLHKEKAGSSRLKQLEREIKILKMISHPSIVWMEQVYESPNKIYLVIEMCELGSLEWQLDRVGRFPEEEVKSMMQQIANAIAYLHRNGIVHRDVKLDNILCTRTAPHERVRYASRDSPQAGDSLMYVKLADFSLSALKEPDEMIESVCGTLIYMSPEVIEDRLYSQQCDVWAMGIIMYQLFAGYAPFRAKNEDTLKQMICEGQLDFSAPLWSAVSNFAIDCIRKLLTVDTAYRISASELLAHRWLNDTANTSCQHPNVIELMKAFRLQSDKQSSHGDDTQSPTSSSSDLQFSDRNSSAGSSSVVHKYSYARPYNRSEPKLDMVTRTQSSLSLGDTQFSQRSDRLVTGRKGSTQQIDTERQRRTRDREDSRSRRISAEDRRVNAASYITPRYVSARQHSPVRYVTNKRS